MEELFFLEVGSREDTFKRSFRLSRFVVRRLSLARNNTEFQGRYKDYLPITESQPCVRERQAGFASGVTL